MAVVHSVCVAPIARDGPAMGLIEWKVRPAELRIEWLEPRREARHVVVNRSRKKVAEQQLAAMSNYIHGSECRATLIDLHFSGKRGVPCDQCDACTADRKELRKALQTKLASGPISGIELLNAIRPGHRTLARSILQHWVKAGAIEANSTLLKWAAPLPPSGRENT